MNRTASLLISYEQIDGCLLSGKSSDVICFRDSVPEEKTGAATEMLSFPLGGSKMDGIRKEDFGGSEYAGCFGDKAGEARLTKYISRRMLRLEVPHRKRRIMDVMLVGVRKVDVKDKVRCRQMIGCGVTV